MKHYYLFLIKNYQTIYNKKLLLQKIFCKTYHIIDKEIKVNRRISFYAFLFFHSWVYIFMLQNFYINEHALFPKLSFIKISFINL